MAARSANDIILRRGRGNLELVPKGPNAFGACHGPEVCCGSRLCKTRLRIPKLLSTNSDGHQRGDFRVFLLFRFSLQPPCTCVQRRTAVGVDIESIARASRSHGCQQWLDADDVQHTREIVAEY